MASADLRDELNCSICLNIYTAPVTLYCGHNFCKICIGNVLDNQKESGIYSCPECKAEYRERPKLQRNMTLCNIAERCRSTQPAENVTGITCTYCVHAPVPAAKTCLHCEASLCEIHLKVHSQSAEHVLTDPTTSLDHWKCSIHKEILKYYCTTDAVCICVSCSLAGEHRGHQVETLNEAHEKKKQTLRNVMDELKKLREEAEKEIQDLTKHEKEVKEKANRMKERVTALIMDTRKQLETLEKKVLLEISMQEQQVSLRISDLIQQLEKKKSEMSKETGQIEELQNMTDPLAVLQAQESFSAGCGDALKEGEKDLCEDVISGTFLTGLANVITGLKKSHANITVTKTFLDINRSTDISLDVNTASNELTVSRDLKTVSRANTTQNRPETPERFEFYPQVLSTRGFTSGRHYWEMETSGDGWIIGMAYPSIDRKGRQSYIPLIHTIIIDACTKIFDTSVFRTEGSDGRSRNTTRGRVYSERPLCYNRKVDEQTQYYNTGNTYGQGSQHIISDRYGQSQFSQTDGIQSYTGDNKSWRLRLYNNVYSVMCDGTVKQLNFTQTFHRIGIYLDYEAGQLSFYELGDPIRHLHTFTTRFTEPLHVAICVWDNASVAFAASN